MWVGQGISEGEREVRFFNPTPNFSPFTVSEVRFISAKQQKSSQYGYSANFLSQNLTRCNRKIEHLLVDRNASTTLRA